MGRLQTLWVRRGERQKTSRVRLVRAVQINGKYFEPGDVVEVDKLSARQLFANGAGFTVW